MDLVGNWFSSQFNRQILWIGGLLMLIWPQGPGGHKLSIMGMKIKPVRCWRNDE